MVKAAVAVKRGTATSEAILKRYNSYNVTHPIYKALAEVGKAEKTSTCVSISCPATCSEKFRKDSTSLETGTRPMTSSAMGVASRDGRCVTRTCFENALTVS